jgi:hypothetical protein
MADDITLPGTSSVVSTDEVDLGGGAAHVQMVKLVDATNGGTSRVPGSVDLGLVVEPRLDIERKVVTPTVSASTYTEGDAVGSWLTFTAVARANGAAVRLDSVQLASKVRPTYPDLMEGGADATLVDVDLILFDRDVSGTSTATDNAALNIVDADLSKIVGVVQLGCAPATQFSAGNMVVNAVCRDQEIVLDSGGDDLIGVMQAKSRFTLGSTSDLTVTATVLRR